MNTISFFHFWHLNVENGTKSYQVVYGLMYCSMDTQYCLSIKKGGWGKMAPKIRKTGTLPVNGY